MQEGSAGPARSLRSGWAVGLGATPKGCAAFIALLTDSLAEQACVYPAAKDGTVQETDSHSHGCTHKSMYILHKKFSGLLWGESLGGDRIETSWPAVGGRSG